MDNETALRMAKRDNLYWNYRYSTGSYKARKAGIQPVLMMAKRGNARIRIYDDGSHQPSPEQTALITARCRAWGQKERELKRLAKKESRRTIYSERSRTKKIGY